MSVTVAFVPSSTLTVLLIPLLLYILHSLNTKLSPIIYKSLLTSASQRATMSTLSSSILSLRIESNKFNSPSTFTEYALTQRKLNKNLKEMEKILAESDKYKENKWIYELIVRKVICNIVWYGGIIAIFIVFYFVLPPVAFLSFTFTDTATSPSSPLLSLFPDSVSSAISSFLNDISFLHHLSSFRSMRWRAQLLTIPPNGIHIVVWEYICVRMIQKWKK